MLKKKEQRKLHPPLMKNTHPVDECLQTVERLGYRAQHR